MSVSSPFLIAHIGQGQLMPKGQFGSASPLRQDSVQIEREWLERWASTWRRLTGTNMTH